MTFREPLWYCGCNRNTLRDPAKPRQWLGLSAGDVERMARFVEAVGVTPMELHTHVPVGRIEGIEAYERGDPMQRVMLGRWPYRIDCMLLYENCCWLVECKERLTHHVLGQVFCYWFWWMRDVEDPIPDRAIVVCEYADEDVVCAADRMGVDVVELPLEKGGEPPQLDYGNIAK